MTLPDFTRESRRGTARQDPARRPVFLKPHGVAHGRFEPVAGIAEDLKAGVFGMAPLTAWMRFSSDTVPANPDLKATLVVGIKLFGVPGPKLLGDGDTQERFACIPAPLPKRSAFRSSRPLPWTTPKEQKFAP